MKYSFDPVRFLRGRARAARTMRNFEDEKNFNTCADRIEKLEGMLKEAHFEIGKLMGGDCK